MSLKSIITLVASGLAVYFYKKDLDEKYAAQQEQFEKERQYYLDEIAKAENKANPNGNADQAPLAITGTVRFGGLTLNQLEVWLNIKNYSSNSVEIGDIRSELYVGGIYSGFVKPSNIGRWVIPANGTKRIRLYARGDVAFPDGEYKNVKRALCALAGIDKIKDGTIISVSKVPAELDIDYLWYWPGGHDECHHFDVPCDFEYKFAGWTVGGYEGYNAGRKNQQEKNPSEWTKYDEQD